MIDHVHVPVRRQDPPLAVVLIYPDAWEAQMGPDADRARVSSNLVEAAFTLSEVATPTSPSVRRDRGVYDQEQHPDGSVS